MANTSRKSLIVIVADFINCTSLDTAESETCYFALFYNRILKKVKFKQKLYNTLGPHRGTLKIIVFGGVAPCSLVDVYRHFGGNFFLRPLGR